MIGNNLNGLLNGKTDKKPSTAMATTTGRDINVITKQNEGNKPYQCKGNR